MTRKSGISYELAKELKDAGFPQGKSAKIYYIVDCPLPNGRMKPQECEQGADLSVVNVSEFCDIPTLSELIEACGEEFHCILKRGEEEGDKWEARSLNTRVNANTPEEAVAQLWIAINKKQ